MQARADNRRQQWWRFAALLIVASLALYLIGNGSVSLWDRDEPRNAEASRQMLQSGDWVVPRFLGDIRTAKPVFIYWCQASAMAVFGDNEFAARFPSSLAMTITVSLLLIALSYEIGVRRATWTAFIFATSGLTIASAKMALTDSVLLVSIVIAQICVYRIWRGQNDWTTWIATGVAVGVGGLTKGPVPLGVMGMTVVVLWVMRLPTPSPSYSGERAGVRGVFGATDKPLTLTLSPEYMGEGIRKALLALAISIAIVTPWLILISNRAPDFLPTIIGHDLIQRMHTGLEGHSAPPGYYFVLIWVTYFPWSLLLPGAIVYGWRHRSEPSTRFALASVIGPWVMFEIFKTKLPHYILPIFPGLALLTARMLIATGRQPRIHRVAVGLGYAVFPIVTIGYGLILPHVDALRISARVGAILHQQQATHLGDVIMIDYKEPSLAFAQGGTIREESDNAYLAKTSPTQWPGWIVMTQAIWDATPETAREHLDRIATVDGFWYSSKFRHASVIVAKKK